MYTHIHEGFRNRNNLGINVISLSFTPATLSLNKEATSVPGFINRVLKVPHCSHMTASQRKGHINVKHCEFGARGDDSGVMKTCLGSIEETRRKEAYLLRAGARRAQRKGPGCFSRPSVPASASPGAS